MPLFCGNMCTTGTSGEGKVRGSSSSLRLCDEDPRFRDEERGSGGYYDDEDD